MTRNIKKLKVRNLLEVSDVEKIKVLREAKANLRQKIAEAKLLNSLLEVENLVINGKAIYSEGNLTGFTFDTNCQKIGNMKISELY